jgi:hypothetical protein
VKQPGLGRKQAERACSWSAQAVSGCGRIGPDELFRKGTVFTAMASPGSTGNVIAALASFFIPGLGQLLQGKWFRALVMFVLAAVLWWFWLGWIVHLWSILDAALYRRPA